MKNEKLVLAVILFFLGLTGVLSILTMEIPLPEEAKKILLSQFSSTQIKLLPLISPTTLLIVAVIIGVFLHKKVHLEVPIIEGMIRKERTGNLRSILKYGIVGGLIVGSLVSLVGLIFYPILPEEFIAFGEKLQPSLAARFLYGGFTEEIIMRFGLMTLIVWVLYKIVRKANAAVYWAGIMVVALLFAVGHFPIAFQAVDQPSALLITYLLVGNAIGGIIFGWLYWKKGLESAFLAHIFAHVVIVIGEL